jgi:hypothetical protein
MDLTKGNHAVLQGIHTLWQASGLAATTIPNTSTEQQEYRNDCGCFLILELKLPFLGGGLTRDCGCRG